MRRLPASKRLEYLVKRVADQREIWSLRNADGWVLGADDTGREMHPVWPHPRYAEASAIGSWAGTQPGRISIRDWLGPWTEGMTREGKLVAIFPTDQADEAAIAADDLAQAIRVELEKVE